MKLSKFIVLFFCCVALFAMLFQSPANARMKQLQIATKTYGQSELWTEAQGGFQGGFFEEVDPFGVATDYFSIPDWCFIKDEIIAEIESSGKSNANETKALLNSIEAAMNGQPFVLTYAKSENMDLLEKCVNTVEFIYGNCGQIKDKIAEIKGIFF